MKIEINDDIQQEFAAVIKAAHSISLDVGQEVEQVLQDGREHPLNREEIAQLLTKVITILRNGVNHRGDENARKALEGDINELVERIVLTQNGTPFNTPKTTTRKKELQLLSRNGMQPRPVFPRPFFHGMDVSMNSGFVKTSDIKLWDGNERLDIHLGQFRQKNGRNPTSEELLNIMLSQMSLPGIPEKERTDQFEIVQLARSIAVNGVRKPPILDRDGTLLDGNRRVTACHYILNSDEFESAQKQRVEYIFVWQLTEHAMEDERTAVVVSLNFENDCKMEWPEYVKARKVYEGWQAMLAVEQRLPGPQRQSQMKRELSRKFALGPDVVTVNRYLKMVDWANEFEEYHINQKQRDTYEVKHQANHYFQYFDELAKGTKPGGVAYALNQDDSFKHMVFDLLFDGKFRNWRQIRELKIIYDNEEARDLLKRAREESDLEVADNQLENAMTIARTQSAEMRSVGVNTRIDTFVKWLEELPVKAFRDHMNKETLKRLLKALKLVGNQAAAILNEVDSEV